MCSKKILRKNPFSDARLENTILMFFSLSENLIQKIENTNCLLLVRDGSRPDAQTEGTLLDQIGQVVDDVQSAHSETGEDTSRLIEEAQVSNGETNWGFVRLVCCRL
jgi:hypothetical protein